MNIKELLQKAIDSKASDLHIIAGLLPILRIDGSLVPIKGEKSVSAKDAESGAFSLLSDKQREDFIKNRDLDFGYSLTEHERFRINMHYEKNNVGLVARVINEKIPTMEDIFMPESTFNLLSDKQGLILVTGPTGCGKSTTLAAMIEHINNNRSCHIVTLEDPIEFIFKSKKSAIIQRELNSDILNFSSGLKHSLRQDPDVIMVGEMRDLETISTALTLAETGHLVFATLHTYSAAQTIDRIIDIFPPHQQNQIKAQVSMTLAAVISQRLLSKKGGGRVAAREILYNNPAIANLIRENKISQIKTVIETGAKDGMISFDQNLKELCVSGVIGKEEAKPYMDNPSLLDKIK